MLSSYHSTSYIKNLYDMYIVMLSSYHSTSYIKNLYDMYIVMLSSYHSSSYTKNLYDIYIVMLSSYHSTSYIIVQITHLIYPIEESLGTHTFGVLELVVNHMSSNSVMY